jgi:hypothetical protein
LQVTFSATDEKLLLEMAGLAAMALSAKVRDQKKVDANERTGQAAAAVHSFLVVRILISISSF